MHDRQYLLGAGRRHNALFLNKTVLMFFYGKMSVCCVASDHVQWPFSGPLLQSAAVLPTAVVICQPPHVSDHRHRGSPH